MLYGRVAGVKPRLLLVGLGVRRCAVGLVRALSVEIGVLWPGLGNYVCFFPVWRGGFVVCVSI
jgi:hypothetical protein